MGCFTPSQPLQLHQGDVGRRRTKKHISVQVKAVNKAFCANDSHQCTYKQVFIKLLHALPAVTFLT